jgi:hypothetical protein
MPDAKPEDRATDAERDELSQGDERGADALEDVDTLKDRGDIEGLLALARAHRSGRAPGGRDMARCLAAYRAAAELGSADAEHAVALFCMSGGVVPQDLKEGAARLRAAAEKGSVAAKVYLGNLYELGIHYRADAEKADVWYKSAARGARIDAEIGSDAYARELAELGCVRYILALVESNAVDGDDKARLLLRARAHGHGLRMKDDNTMQADGPAFLDALASDRTPRAAAPRDPVPRSLQRADAAASTTALAANTSGPDRAERQRATTTPDTKSARAAAQKASDETTALDEPRASKSASTRARPAESARERTAIGFGAFGYALLFVIAGLGAAYAATLGAYELVAHGKPLPGLGTRAELVFPIVLGLVGVLPALLVYRFGTFVKALVIGAMLGGIGWIAWGTGQAVLHTSRAVESLAFGLAGFLAGLLVLGLLGGTKRQPARQRR